MITPNKKIDFAIITALPEELDAVLSKLGHYQSVGTKTDSLPFYGAEIGRTQVLVTRSGPGNTKAAIAGNTVLERFHPDHVLMVGIAAGFQGKVDLGDVVVAEACYYDGPGKETSEGKLPAPRQLPTGAFLSARSKDYNALDWKDDIQVQSPGGSSQPSVHHGVIVSSETVVGNPERMASLLATHRDCRALAMEGYGVAEAAWHNRIDFLEIRGICDFGDGNKNDNWHKYAAHAAAAYVVGLLRYIEPLISTKSATAWEGQSIFLEHHVSPPVSQAPPLTAEERRDLPKLLKAVHYIWIEGQLEDYSLHVHQRPLIALEKQAMPEHVERYRDRLLARPERESQILPADKAISAVFQEVRNFLLILGDPGAGKTVTLLELARDLIASAQNNTSQPIPVIFNLSTWVESQKKGLFEKKGLFDWLVEQFDLWYRIPKKASAAWLQQQRLFLLLDGLDEVKAKHRASCVVAINAFVDKYQPPGVVVCCRLEEYVALGDMRLQLEGAVCLQPFTEAQIATYLDRAHLTNVQTVIAQDENLRELAKTPLLLDVISVAYENVTVEEVSHSATETLETRQQQLFDRYLDKMFERKAVKKEVQSSLLDKLKWLARKMRQQGEQVFFIEHLRPSYLGSQAWEKFFQYLFGIGMAVFMGLLVFIIGKRTPFVLSSSGSGVLWLWAGMVVVMMMGTFWFSIKHSVPETVRWSWKGAINWMILWSCVIGIPAGFFLVYQGTFNIGNVGKWLQNRVGLDDKVLLILGGMLLFGWLGFFVGGVTQGQLPDDFKVSPNQGIHQAIKNLWFVILPFSVGVGVFFTVEDSSSYSGLTMGMIALLLGGLLFGGLVPIIQHYYVRFLLFASHRLPFRPVTFLNQATQLFLLRRVGGGYKFIHRLVLDHLAEKFDPAKEQQAVKKVTALFVSSLLVIMFISVMMVNLLFKGIVNLDHQFLYEGGRYYYDNGNYGVAFRFLSPLADEGYVDAQNYLGRMYQYGRGVAKDEALAEKWYQRAAEQGNADAQTSLGSMYQYGQGVAKDEALAEKWYRRAAEQGNAGGHYNLCWLYITQHKLKEANITCQRGYKLFPDHWALIVNLGHLQFLERNYQQARAYYEEALVKCSDCFRFGSWIISDLEFFITKNWHPEEAKRLIACVKEKAEALELEREFEPTSE